MVTVGQVFATERVFSQADFDRFAALSGDDNPIHTDPAFAARTRFGRTVSHGMLLYGVICAALAQFAPGALQCDQELIFPAPTYTGEPIGVRLQVIAVEPAARRARLETLITKADGTVVCQGRTTVEWPEQDGAHG